MSKRALGKRNLKRTRNKKQEPNTEKSRETQAEKRKERRELVGSGASSSGFGIRDSGSGFGIRDREAGIRDRKLPDQFFLGSRRDRDSLRPVFLGSGIRDSGSPTSFQRDSGSGIRDRDQFFHGIRDPGFGIRTSISAICSVIPQYRVEQ